MFDKYGMKYPRTVGIFFGDHAEKLSKWDVFTRYNNEISLFLTVKGILFILDFYAS